MTAPQDDFEKRLASFEGRLKQADEKIHPPEKGTNEALNTGAKAGIELVGAIAGGALIGYGIDTWAGTKPVFLVAMLVLGIITGFVNVWRVTSGQGHAVGYKKKDAAPTAKESLTNDGETSK